jgi:nucleosome binding factor SPN SPT16 subunit
MSGKFIKEWEAASKDANLEFVDVTSGIAAFLAVKDEEELVRLCYLQKNSRQW